MSDVRLTPTQRCMMQVLSDGVSHRPEELKSCLLDDMAVDSTLSVHLTNLRKRIRPNGQDVSSELVNGSTYYRLVRLTASPYNGRT